MGLTALSGAQAQPAPGFSSLNPLAVPWDSVLGLSRASPHEHSSVNAHTGPTHGLLRSSGGLQKPLLYPPAPGRWLTSENDDCVLPGLSLLPGGNWLGRTAKQAFASTTGDAALASLLQWVQDQSDYGMESLPRTLKDSQRGQDFSSQRGPRANKKEEH
ncbi:hypothetical protein WJX77_004289 [Trebouxia sp. C0004]